MIDFHCLQDEAALCRPYEHAMEEVGGLIERHDPLSAFGRADHMRGFCGNPDVDAGSGGGAGNQTALRGR